MKRYPNKNLLFPNKKIPSLCYIKNAIKNHKQIIVGDFTYYDDIKEGGDSFEKHVTHLYSFSKDKLIIGKFCSIAHGVEFIMNSANHRMSCVTAYPFYIMGGEWGNAIAPHVSELPNKGDTIIGNDVWIGQNVTFLPGVKVGNGAIIGANSVVSKDVPAYCIAAGNPIRIIRKRFDDELIKLLEEFKWWDKPIKEINNLIPLLSSSNLNNVKKKLKILLKKDSL